MWVRERASVCCVRACESVCEEFDMSRYGSKQTDARLDGGRASCDAAVHPGQRET